MVNTVPLIVKPGTPWEEILDKMRRVIVKIRAHKPGRHGIPAKRKHLRMMFDRTHLIPDAVSGMRMHIPICPTDRNADTFDLEGLYFKFKNFGQVKDINNDKISGSFLVQVFYRAAEKLYYLGQRSVLSRWSRSTCANCQGRRMAHVSIPIRGGDTAPYDSQNLEVHLVNKDRMTGKYI